MARALLRKRRRLPVIIASETAECGLACLAMIGVYHGHDIDLTSLRARYALSSAGITLRTMIATADQMQLSTRAYQTELESIRHIKTPAILHWDLSHFVVLKAAGPRHVIIHDPNRGEQKLSYAETSKHFSGVVLELEPQRRFSAMRDRTKVRLTSLWTEARGHWSAATQTLILSLCLQVTTFAIPFFIQLVTDAAIVHDNRRLLATLAIAFAAVIALQAMLGALRDWTIQIFGNLLTFQISANLVSHLLRLPTSFFEKRHVGDILSRIGSTADIQDIVTRGVLSVLLDGAMAAVAVVVLVAYSPPIASVVIGAMAINVAIAVLTYARMRTLNEDRLIASAQERSHLLESIRAHSTIKLLGAEAQRESVWKNLFAKLVNANLSIARSKTAIEAVQTGITNLSGILVVYLAAGLVMRHDHFTVGMLFAFISFRQTFTDRAGSLLTQLTQFRLLGLHLDRMGDIIAAVPDRAALPETPVDVRGGIQLRGICYRYGSADPVVLQNLTLEVAPGEYVAITGPSGGGKTTLLKVMLGLVVPTEGEVVLDGQVATPALFRQWRTQVGVVAQNDRLMSGSIAENISFFDPEIDQSAIEAAARLAHLHDDIARMPCTYASLVGDMGSTLSEGQKQRVLLARALYRRPKVLILDEGTANLDPDTEQLIADVISSLPVTRVVVAHRPALIERADRTVSIGSSLDLLRGGERPRMPPRRFAA